MIVAEVFPSEVVAMIRQDYADLADHTAVGGERDLRDCARRLDHVCRDRAPRAPRLARNTRGPGDLRAGFLKDEHDPDVRLE